MSQFRVDRRVWIDAAEACRWYRERSPRAAVRLWAAVERTLERIRANPRHFAEYDGTFRAAPVRKFPYLVQFGIDPDGAVTVYAVAHTKADWGSWKTRLGPSNN